MHTTSSRATARELRYVRGLRERSERSARGLCFVEGIRQVVSAVEGGHAIEAVYVDETRLQSSVGLEAIERAVRGGARHVVLTTAEFERISSRDNPVGLAAVVHWQPRPLATFHPPAQGLILATDNVRDPGNLGTLIRTADAAGCAAVIVHGGVDPAHPTALRASLGTTFLATVVDAPTLDACFDWASRHQIPVLATTARNAQPLWELGPVRSAVVLVGNEGVGLGEETIARADLRVTIPMFGSATSLNVSVAAGIVLFELARRRVAGEHLTT